MTDTLKIILTSTGTAIVGFLASQMNWIRFLKRDKANVKKIESEISIDNAESDSRKADTEIKISKAALEWTVQIAEQLERANDVSDKRQVEIDRLHSVINTMRTDFNKRIQELEEELDKTQEEINNERMELERLKKEISHGKN